MMMNFFFYWVLNLPLSYVFAFQLNYGFKGLWIAMALTLVLLTCSYQMMIALADWNESHAKA